MWRTLYRKTRRRVDTGETLGSPQTVKVTPEDALNPPSESSQIVGARGVVVEDFKVNVHPLTVLTFNCYQKNKQRNKNKNFGIPSLT